MAYESGFVREQTHSYFPHHDFVDQTPLRRYPQRGRLVAVQHHRHQRRPHRRQLPPDLEGEGLEPGKGQGDDLSLLEEDLSAAGDTQRGGGVLGLTVLAAEA